MGVCARVSAITQNGLNAGTRNINMLFYMMKAWKSLTLCNQGQCQGRRFKTFSTYHNTNCQVLYLSFPHGQGDEIKIFCSI